jgi:hypothetical protein
MINPTQPRFKDAKRIVMKIGSALVVDNATAAPRAAWLASVAADIAALRAGGAEVVVVSSGAIALARKALGLTRRRLRLEEKQAAAAVGQIRLAGAWQEALAAHGLNAAQLLLTLEDSEDRRRYLNARATLATLLGLGCVPVINADASEARNTIGPIMSSSSPTRPSLIFERIHALRTGSDRLFSASGVRTKVGQSVLIRMPCGAHSIAIAFVMPSSACLLAQ